MKSSHTFIPAIVIVAIGSAALFLHSSFFYQADGYMSPRTAEKLGLLASNEAPFSGGLAFRKNPEGGYDYRSGRAIAFFGTTSHTNIDLADACMRVGGCEWRH